MAAESVGEIGLDLVLNSSDLSNQISTATNRMTPQIGSAAKKIGAALTAAFATTKLISFGKQCIELGSDLSEVQNVVDVTFSTMSAKVDEFAKSAAQSFGLSETMAKQYTGTFGAMAKAFGFSEQEAYDMSTALTGLAGDVASFYNLDQSEAYTKLKSVFTGETESLKDLGIVMTQTSLDSYALANGFGKTTSAMTEQEKVALRYQFVMNQLSLAQGDFARTSDSWANQSRLMALQIQSIMATIGQGLINLFTPVLKVINTVLGKIAKLAEAFKGFTELITGKKSKSGSGITDNLTSGLSDATTAASDAGSGLSDAADSAGTLADNTGAVGSAAKKAAKEMKTLMGFDEVNKLSEQTDSDSGSGSGGSGSGGNGSGGSGSGGSGLSGLGSGATDFGQLADTEDNALTKVNETLDKIIKKVKELAEICKKGFFDGLGDLSVLDSIKDECESIQKSVIAIFTDEKVVQSADQFAKTVAYNLGKIAGSAASTGLSIADNLLGGISEYLEKNTDRISQYIADMFDISSARVTLAGDVAELVAEIASVLRSDTAKQITTDVIEIFANGFMGVSKLLSQFKKDLETMVVKPLTNNATKIKDTIKGLLEPVQTVTGTIASSVSQTFESIDAMYQEHIAPMFETVTQGLSDLVTSVLSAIDTHIKPALDNFADGFAGAWTSSIQPAIDQAITLAGKIADCVDTLWQECLQPLVQWFIDTFGSALGETLTMVGDLFTNFVTVVGSLTETLLAALGGVSDALSTLFTWLSENQTAATIITGIIAGFTAALSANTIAAGAMAIAHGAVSAAIGIYNGVIAIATGVTGAFSAAVAFLTSPITLVTLAIAALVTAGVLLYQNWDTVKAKAIEIWGAIKDWFEETTGNIAQFFKDLWLKIEDTFLSIGDWFKAKFDAAYANIKSAFSGCVAFFSGIWSGIKKVFSDVKTWLGNTFQSAWNGIVSIWNGARNWFSNHVTEPISDLFTNLWNGIKDYAQNTWNNIVGIFKAGGSIFTGFVSSVKDVFVSLVNGIIRGINNVINIPFRSLNSVLSGIKGIDILGAKPFGWVPTINVPQIPQLAQGGYVRANTPQLAMIGDNRHQGEVVAPEGKLVEMAKAAASEAGSPEQLRSIINLLETLISLVQGGDDIVLAVDGEELARAMMTGSLRLKRRYSTVTVTV